GQLGHPSPLPGPFSYFVAQTTLAWCRGVQADWGDSALVWRGGGEATANRAPGVVPPVSARGEEGGWGVGWSRDWNCPLRLLICRLDRFLHCHSNSSCLVGGREFKPHRWPTTRRAEWTASRPRASAATAASGSRPRLPANRWSAAPAAGLSAARR